MCFPQTIHFWTAASPFCWNVKSASFWFNLPFVSISNGLYHGLTQRRAAPQFIAHFYAAPTPFFNSTWMIPSSNGNAVGMLPPRMKNDSCSAVLTWKTLRKIRLRYRRTSDSPASVCPRLALPPLCCDNDPFHRWNQTLSHVDASVGMKTVMPGFPARPRIPWNTLICFSC